MKLSECVNAFFEEDPIEDEIPSDEDGEIIVDDPGYDDEFVDQSVLIMANAIAAGISEIEEKIGFDPKIKRLDDVMKFSTHIMNLLRISRRDALRKALLKYKRLGTDRFRREYRRTLGKEGDIK